MGPYLTTPKKDKEVENGDTKRVSTHFFELIESFIKLTFTRLNMALVECKAGETQWKIHIFVL